MKNARPVNYEKEIPDILEQMAGIHNLIDACGLDVQLCHLVMLRASQINYCGYCVERHTREALEDGETNDRLNRVVVWDQVQHFSEKEKAAFAWTEALTFLDRKTDFELLRENLRTHYSDREIGAMTALVGMINLWNRIRISEH